MAIPNSAVGYGNNSTARNVFRLTFSAALSALPTYEAYDGGTFPAVGAAVTTALAIFAGTAGNSNKPMLSLVDTSNAAPASNWKPATATAGGAVQINRMKGTTNFVTAAGSIPGAAGSITWNEVLEIPSDATTGAAGMAHDLLVRYTYTGGAPTLTWAFNDAVSGTEGAPTWTTMTAGTHGIRHCRAGTVSGGPYLANIPASSTEDTTMGWVTV
jgi:hypothetical protein